MLPFQLKRALHCNAGGLGVVAPSRGQQSNAFSQAGDALLDPDVGGGRRAKVASEAAGSGDQLDSGIPGAEEGSGLCKVVRMGEEFALGGLDVVTTVFA